MSVRAKAGVSHSTGHATAQAGCRLLTLPHMPILTGMLLCVFRVSHGRRTCGMLRTAGSTWKSLIFGFMTTDTTTVEPRHSSEEHQESNDATA